MTKLRAVQMDDDKPVTEQPQQAISLPSPNIEHSATLENELQGRLHQFKSGIIALQGELEGQEQAFQAEAKERKDKHEAAKADLTRRIGDLQKGERMLSAALDVADEKQ